MEPIAIVGIGCRFPGGAESLDAFWDMLCEGRDGVIEVPPDRWNLRKFYDPDPRKPAKVPIRHAAFLHQSPWEFDAAFFGISPREAAGVDPQQRLLLELTWEAMEDAGLVPETLAGGNTGVFMGGFTTDAATLAYLAGNAAAIGTHTGISAALAALAGRLSYTFDLRGPCITIDTACSSSLVALHYAANSLRNGECDVALAGGVNVMFTPTYVMVLSKGGFLSLDGRCKSFDARADGYGRGEGAGVVALKRLSDAVASGDLIYALIRGSAVNQDGATSGFTVPNADAQLTAIRDAHRRGNTSPADVVYVEAHGTGTAIGDPTEAKAIGAVVGRASGRSDACVVGSVKANIGHLEAAAGVAGLIKTVLCLQRREIPPLANLKEPNPAIPFDELGLRLATTRMPLPARPGITLAGVNSFGFTGTNAHVVLEAAPRMEDVPAADGVKLDRPVILPISARNDGALRAFAGAYLQFLAPDGAGASVPLRDACYSASSRRGQHDRRLAVIGGSREELLARLRLVHEGETGPGIVTGHATPGHAPRIAFVFTGMGPQWRGMGRELFAREPVFRAMIERCDALFRRHTDRWSLCADLQADEGSSVSRTEWAQWTNFALQAALTELWRAWGVEAHAIVGHSVGEVGAAYACGALSLEDAVLVSYHRGRLQARAEGKGAMLAVGLPPAEAASLIEGRSDVGIAAINGADSVTLSGDPAALKAIGEQLATRGVLSRALQVDVAYHSSHMDGLRDELVQCLGSLAPKAPTTPLYSTALGAAVDGPVSLDASYWWSNVREPVRFADAVAWLLERDCDTFLEVGPHPVLSPYIAEGVAARQRRATIIASLRRQRPEQETMLEALAKLYGAGASIAWRRVLEPQAPFVRLPRYPWQREHHWAESAQSKEFRLGSDLHPLLGRAVVAPAATWEAELNAQAVPYLSDHMIEGVVVVAGACYIEAVLAAAQQMFGDGGCDVSNVKFHRVLVADVRRDPTIRVSVDPDDHSYTIHSRDAGDPPRWNLHSTGELRAHPAGLPPARLDLDAIRQRCTTPANAPDAYVKLRELGLVYGDTFCAVRELWLGLDGEVLSRVSVDDAVRAELAPYRVHPTLLDSAFQTLFMYGLYAPREFFRLDTGLYLPMDLKRLRLHAAPGADVWCYGRFVSRTERFLEGSIRLCDAAGNVLVEADGLRVAKMTAGPVNLSGRASALFYKMSWEPDQAAVPRIVPARDLVDPGDIAREVAATADGLEDPLLVSLDELERQLCSAYIVAALARLGVRLREGDVFNDSDVAEQVGVTAERRRLFARLLAHLAADGVLRAAGGGWEVVATPSEVDPQELLNATLWQFHEDEPELSALADCGGRLSDLLTGRLEGLPEVTERLHQSRRGRIDDELTRQAITAALARLPEGASTLRILEIGGGDGATTAGIMPGLPAARVQYFFTDPAQPALFTAAERFKDHAFVQYRLLDIDRPPGEQGFADHDFDVVVVPRTLHRSVDLPRALGHLARLLTPDGLVIIGEHTAPSAPVLSLVLGSQPSWWRFTDQVRTDSPLIPLESWRTLLDQAGFTDSACVPDPATAPSRLRQSVLIARKSAAAAEPVRASTPALDGDVLVFADATGVGRALAERLRADGRRVIVARPGKVYERLGLDEYAINPRDPEQVSDLVEAAQLREGSLREAVYLWALDASVGDETLRPALDDMGLRDCVALAHIVQALTRGAKPPTMPRLWIVTRGAEAVGAAPHTVNPHQAAARALGLSIRSEHPEISCRLVDLDPTAADAGSRLLDEITNPSKESVVAYRDEGRYVARFLQVAKPVPAPASADVRTTALRLENSAPGDLTKLVFRRTERHQPGPDGVEIQVASSGLNFRDLMVAQAMITETEGGIMGSTLGCECAGVVTRVGDRVAHVRPGDEVAALGPSCLGTFVVTPAHLVVHKPASLTWDQAGATFLPLCTAYYSLVEIARLQPGESILIHAAAGGVGLSAIQVARWRGARVFATAGSPEKHAYLRSIGVEHVSDSRSMKFVDDILEWTDGRGVDVVLNSLQGQLATANFSVLAPYGRFVEIGKRDVERGAKLDLRPFARNLAFRVFDIDRFCKEQPDESQRVMKQVADLIDAGEFTALPLEVFRPADVEAAFRVMARAQHIGRLAVSFDVDHIETAPAERTGGLCRADASYVVTGGLSGFGLKTAEWLVGQGARHLILLGRRGVATPAAAEAVDALRRRDVDVAALAGDITDVDQLAAILDDARRTMPPVRGVVHAAMVMDAALLADETEERLQAVLAPKILGAWNLHVLTRDLPLDFFVLYSSAIVVLAQEGQSAYRAGNAFLDALALYRRALGLPALSVNWGALGDAGYLARHENDRRMMEGVGIGLLPVRQALRILGELVRADAAWITVADIDWDKLAAALPRIAEWPMLEEIWRGRKSPGGARGGAGEALRVALRSMSREARLENVVAYLRERTAHVLGMVASRLDVEQSLSSLGWDSLMAAELKVNIGTATGVEIPIVRLVKGDSLREIAGFVCEQLEQHAAA